MLPRRNNSVSSLPDDKILDPSKMKAFPDYNVFAALERGFYFEFVEYYVGKGESACYQYFLLFSHGI